MIFCFSDFFSIPNLNLSKETHSNQTEQQHQLHRDGLPIVIGEKNKTHQQRQQKQQTTTTTATPEKEAGITYQMPVDRNSPGN